MAAGVVGGPGSGAGRADRAGAMVLSLDFELMWGVYHMPPRWIEGYRPHLLGARAAVPGLLDLFREFDVAATWAIVGGLFAASWDELEPHLPSAAPGYTHSRFDPPYQRIRSGADAELYFAPDLVDRIAATPQQEVATHTFCHYFCLEAGQTRDQFAADLRSAIGIGRTREVEVRSIVLPGNQWNAAYAPVLRECGIVCFRGTPPSRHFRPTPFAGETLAQRAGRLASSYLPLGEDLPAWGEVAQPDGLANVWGSFFLRPCSVRPGLPDRLRMRRLLRAMRRAAQEGRIFHLWWHPHNFGAAPDANLAALRELLEEFVHLRDRYGMQSLSMLSAAQSADPPRFSADVT